MNDFFISHSGDIELAKELKRLLYDMNPEWKVFLDVSDRATLYREGEIILEEQKEWFNSMLKEAENSKYLIAITTDANKLKFPGWIYKEVKHFCSYNSGSKHINDGRHGEWFTIFFGGANLDGILFEDLNKGAEYRELYDGPQHLMLWNEKTVEEAKERIKNKVLNLTKESQNLIACEICDKVRAFTEKKGSQDAMFSPSAIESELTPSLKDGEGNYYYFSALCDALEATDIAILGSEGGSGKTSLLTKLFFHYLETASSEGDGFIPLYIDAKALASNNNLILRYIAKTVFNEQNAMTDFNTGEAVNKLTYEFSRPASKPKYILLIDGYNEIPSDYLSYFDKELCRFLIKGDEQKPNAEFGFSNVRVVMSGRHLGENIAPEFLQLSLCELQKKAIINYLGKRDLLNTKIEETLMRILRIPMYLKLYAQTAMSSDIKSKGQLLYQFINWQKSKEQETATTNEQKMKFEFFSCHLLPFLAFEIANSDTSSSAFVFSEKELINILKKAKNFFDDEDYKLYMGRDYRNKLRCVSSLDITDLFDDVSDYFLKNSKLLRENSDGSFEFIHQIYRDFFSALFIKSEIERAVSENLPLDFLAAKPLETDVKEFICELLNEPAPTFNYDTLKWDYSCNSSSNLYALPEIARNHNQNSNSILVSNIIELIKHTRNLDLSNLDFSLLDLSDSDLRACTFSKRDKDGIYATSFAGAKINYKNLFSENHFAAFRAACCGEKIVACADFEGVIKIWKKQRNNIAPLKIITNVPFPITKLEFSEDENALFALAPHEIIKISIPQEYKSKAQIEILYRSNKRITDFRIDSSGEFFFKTALNSFNEKPISNPDIPDEVEFYGINSATFLTPDKKTLAFGHIVGYDGLKIYNFNDETIQWIERKFGYSKLLEEFICDFEKLLGSLGLYRFLPDDNNSQDFSGNTRRSFFDHVQIQFEDSTHDYERVPGKIRDRVYKELEEKVTVYESQREKIEELVAKHTENIAKLHRENTNLLHIAGRKIDAIDIKKDGKTLLLSCVKFRDPASLKKAKHKQQENENKPPYSTSVIELNIDTLETRQIVMYNGKSPLKARYCGEDIVVLSDYNIYVYDALGNNTAHLSALPRTVGKIIHDTETHSIYALSLHFIYEFDEEGICKNAINNIFGSYNIKCVKNESGERFFSRKRAFKDAKKEDVLLLLDAMSGEARKIKKDELTETNTKNDEIKIDSRSFKISSNNYVSFTNNIIDSRLTVFYKLFIVGCDFRGVEGEIAENKQLLGSLSRYGAITDSIEKNVILPEKSYLSFTPSQKPFEMPENDTPSLFNTAKGVMHHTTYEKMDASNLVSLRTWKRIYEGTYKKDGLEAADFSILEWASILRYITPEMIYDLMCAGVCGKHIGFQMQKDEVQRRISEILHSRYKLLFRWVFLESETAQIEDNRILGEFYGLSIEYGAKLLRKITTEIVYASSIKLVSTPQKVRRFIEINRWFCTEMRRNGEMVTDYYLDTVLDTDRHFLGRGNAHCLLIIGEQPILAQTFFENSDKEYKEIANKIYRLCLLSENYQNIVLRESGMEVILKKIPVIVLIANDFEQCKELNGRISSICPHIRKLYTYSSLHLNEEKAEGDGCYIEFVNGKPFGVNLKDI